MTALPQASLLIFASCFATVSGLQCYRCSREHNTDALQYCALNSSALGNNENFTCGSDQTKCIISKIILGNGTVFLFTRKCAKDDNQCPGCLAPNENGEYHCNSCCGGDLCNNGTGPIPSPTPSPTSKTTPETTQSTPPVAAQSGSSRIQLISDLCMFGYFLVCFLVYKVMA